MCRPSQTPNLIVSCTIDSLLIVSYIGINDTRLKRGCSSPAMTVLHTRMYALCVKYHTMCDYNDNTISQPNQQVVVFHDRYIRTHVSVYWIYCLLRSSPCWLDDNNRLESSSKGSSCPAVAGWYTCEDYHTWQVTRSNRPYAIRKKYTRVTRE